MVPEARCPERGHAGAAHRSGIFQVDVLKECQEVLGPSGVTAVQLSPVAEHLVGPQWWVRPAVAERIEGWGEWAHYSRCAMVCLYGFT